MTNPTVLSDVSDLLIQDIHPRLESQVYKKNVLLETFEKGTGMRAMDNNTFLIDMQTTEHSGVYFVNPAATSDLSTGAPRYDQATVTAKAGFGSHSITDFALTAAKGKPGAIVNLATSFGDAVQAQLRRSMNRQFVGLGGTATGNAKIADVNGGSSGTTVTVDGYGTRFIMPGALVSIGTTAEHAAGTQEDATVDTVTSATAFTITGAKTVVDDDLIKFTGAHDQEMNGLQNIVSASVDLQGITRSTNYWSQSYIDDTSEALSEADMVSALIEADKVGDVNVVVTGSTLYMKYASLLTSLKRTPQESKLIGGFVGLEFAAGKPGVAVYLEHDTAFGEVYFLSTSTLSIGKLDMGWLDQGAGIFQRVDLRPAWWASYKFYGNLGALNLRANSALRAKTV